MKKLCVLITVMMGVLFLFGYTAWAGEASVFDSVQGILVRVSTACTSGCGGLTPMYSAKLGAWDTEGLQFAGNQLVVAKENGTVTSYTAGTDDTFLIHDNDLTTPDVSMSFDVQTGLTYVFCTDTPDGLHMMKFRVALAGSPVNGVCGTSNNTCTAGTLNDVADTSTNYLWNCNGANGGTPASCSLPKPINGVCGTTNNSCTSGTLVDITDSSTNYLWNCNGANGGTPASCSLPIAVPGALPDLVLSYVGSPSSATNGLTFKATATVTNKGTGPAGSFTVKGYVGMYSTPSGDQQICAQTVPGLGAGQSTTVTLTCQVGGLAVHTYYFLVIAVDADGQVPESNEGNNIYYRGFFIL